MPRKRRKKGSQPRNEFPYEDMATSIRDEITQLFNKKFTLKDEHQTWTLPDSEYLFKEEPFTLSELLVLKEELNSTKSLLNDMDIEQWHQHTRRMHKAGLVVRHLREQAHAEMCTQAWAKFYEILGTYELISTQSLENKQFNSVHLCEAPGAFIASLNHYLKNNVPQVHWKWLGTTLNPYYEGNDLNAMLDDDSFILETMEHWNFGSDGTGDLMSLKNLKSLKEDCEEGMGSVHLVTADGSINCADDPGEQEKVVGPLIFCETLAALEILCQGGNYVFKMFTALEHHMVTMMYLLCCVFKQVHLIKPGTSKSGNSEVYVVCIDYCGTLPIGYQEIFHGNAYRSNTPDKALFPLKLIPTQFIEKLSECQQFFIEKQKDEIMENIQHFHLMGKLEKKYIFEMRNQVALHYGNVFNVRPLKDSDRIISGCYLDGVQRTQSSDVNANEHFSNRKKTGTYNDRHHHDNSWLDSIKQDHEAFTFNPSSCTSLTGLSQSSEGVQLLPLSPDHVPWLVAATDKPEMMFTITIGKTIRKVLNSRFCSSYFITTLNAAMERASIFASSQENALVQILQQTSPRFTVDKESCYYCGVCPSVLDRLVRFTDVKLDEGRATNALVLDSQSPCHCFANYVQSQDITVNNCMDRESMEGHKKSELVELVVAPSFNSMPSYAWKNVDQPLELLSKKDLLDSCIAGLKVLKPGGTFVCRLFMSLTRFTSGLLYILHNVFQQVTIVKPVVGYLWHPERFLVCKGYLGCGQEVLCHLEKVSTVMTTSLEEEDVLEIVDIRCLFQDKFFRFIRTINEELTHVQLVDIVRLETIYTCPTAMITNEQRDMLNKEITQHFNL